MSYTKVIFGSISWSSDEIPIQVSGLRRHIRDIFMKPIGLFYDVSEFMGTTVFPNVFQFEFFNTF